MEFRNYKVGNDIYALRDSRVDELLAPVLTVDSTTPSSEFGEAKLYRQEVATDKLLKGYDNGFRVRITYSIDSDTYKRTLIGTIKPYNTSLSSQGYAILVGDGTSGQDYWTIWPISPTGVDEANSIALRILLVKDISSINQMGTVQLIAKGEYASTSIPTFKLWSIEEVAANISAIPTKSSWDYDDTYVKYSTEQILTDAQKDQARSNIGAGTSNFTGYTSSNKLAVSNVSGLATVATSGSYSNLTNKPTINGVEITGTKTSTDLKLGEVTGYGGFQAGTGASAGLGGAIGSGATAELGGAIGGDATATGGGAVGRHATTTIGGAVGGYAEAQSGGAVGNGAVTTGGGAIGTLAKAGIGFAGGYQAESRYAPDGETEVSAVAIGYNAKAQANDTVQLGMGTNSTEGTLQFRTYRLVDADGKIPASRLPAASTSSLGGVKSGGDVLIRNGEITISETSGFINFDYIDEWNTAYSDSEVTEVSTDGITYSNQAEFRDGQAGMSYARGHYTAQLPVVAGDSISITNNANNKAEISVTGFFAPDVNYTSVTELYKIIGVETERDPSDYDLSDTKEVGQGTYDFINASAVFYTPGATWPVDLGVSQELERLLKAKPCIFTSCQAPDPDWKGSILAYRESIWADYGYGNRLYDLWDEYDYNSSYATWSHNDSNEYKVTIATNSIVTTLKSIPTKTSQLKNDSGFIQGNPTNDANVKTKYRIANRGYTDGANWYYKLCTLPINNSDNYASVIISGRIGGWESGNMSCINALVWNRGTPSISVIDIAGTASAMSNVWAIGDLVLYVESDNSATLYILCKDYFTFDLNIELYQGAIVYDGTYTTSPSGTSTALASQVANRLELCNGKATVGGSGVVLDNTMKVVIGADASGSSTYDIAIGNGATVSNGDGRGVSVAIGQAAEATSTYCTAVGSAASATAKHATAYGHAANATRDSSTAIGYNANALSLNSTAVGRGSTAETGGQSVAIGYIAKTAASYATAIGSNAQAHSANSTAIGHTAIIPSSDGENVFQLGNSDISVLRAAVSLTTTSDERDKADIEEVYSALDFVMRLRPITFVRNSREKYISEENKESDKYIKYGMCDYDKEAHASGMLKGSRRRIGLLAQETQQAMVDIYGTDNYANIVNDNFHDLEEKPKDVENKLTLAYANLVPFLIGAIKEQQAQIEELKNKLK